jgi:hypothetical protein
MKKGESVRVFRNRQCRFVHQLADGEVRQQKTIELLPYQFRGFAAQYDLTPRRWVFNSSNVFSISHLS